MPPRDGPRDPPSLAGAGPGERVARPRPPERERPARAAEHAAAAPRPAARPERPAAAGEPRRADRPRRFRITQQDDEAQFERTMRQFLTEPGRAAEATDPPA